mgnify:CR=1 FL=1
MKQNPNVWVIDNNEIDLLVATRLITLCQPIFQIQGFANATEAILKLNQNKNIAENLPDIILTETHLPILDGYGFIEKHQALIPHIVKASIVLVLSSQKATPKFKYLIQNQVIADYLEKPIGAEMLCQTIRQLC